MRVECSDCLSVYESEDADNEEQTPCPYCGTWSDRATLRQFMAAPRYPSPERASDAPSSPEKATPVRSSRVPISCPPPSRSIDKPHRSSETPAYVRAVERSRDPARDTPYRSEFLDIEPDAPPPFRPAADDA